MLMKKTQRQWQDRSSYPFRRVQWLPSLSLIFMHHMIETKEIPATVLVKFSKLMLHTFSIYRKWKIKAYWQTFQFCKPIYSSMWWSGEWCRHFFFDFVNTRYVIVGKFSPKPHGRSICHIWVQYGSYITISTFLIYVRNRKKEPIYKIFGLCAKNIVYLIPGKGGYLATL